MNKIIKIKLFNNILDDLFSFLEDNFSQFKSDIILVRTATNLIRKSNPRLVVEQFVQYVGPYSDQIFACDENFFLNFEKNQSIRSSLDNNNLVLGMRLRDIWMSQNITQIQKATVFLFFQKLITSGKECT